MAKDTLTVQNIVATTSLGKTVPLTKLARSQSNTEYNPEQFPGLVLRIPKPKSAVLVFSSGNLVCTGTKSVEQVPGLVYKLAKPNATFLLFSNGKLVCTGTKNRQQLDEAMKQLLKNTKAAVKKSKK